MDYERPRGAPAGAQLTDRERSAMDLYVITPRAVRSLQAHVEKYESVTAFYERGATVEPMENAVAGGLFGNQAGFECEEDCWVTTVTSSDPQKRGYLTSPCLQYWHELRPLLDLYLFLAGKTYCWCAGDAGDASATPSMTLLFAEDGSLTTSKGGEASTWEVSGPRSVVVHHLPEAHELTLSRFRLEFESRSYVEAGDGGGAVLHRGYCKV